MLRESNGGEAEGDQQRQQQQGGGSRGNFQCDPKIKKERKKRDLGRYKKGKNIVSSEETATPKKKTKKWKYLENRRKAGAAAESAKAARNDEQRDVSEAKRETPGCW